MKERDKGRGKTRSPFNNSTKKAKPSILCTHWVRHSRITSTYLYQTHWYLFWSIRKRKVPVITTWNHSINHKIEAKATEVWYLRGTLFISLFLAPKVRLTTKNRHMCLFDVRQVIIYSRPTNRSCLVCVSWRWFSESYLVTGEFLLRIVVSEVLDLRE